MGVVVMVDVIRHLGCHLGWHPMTITMTTMVGMGVVVMKRLFYCYGSKWYFQNHRINSIGSKSVLPK